MTAEMLDKSCTAVVWEKFDYQVLIPIDFNLLSLTWRFFFTLMLQYFDQLLQKLPFFLPKKFQLIVNKILVKKSY